MKKIRSLLVLLLMMQLSWLSASHQRHRRHALAFIKRHQPVSINSATPMVLQGLIGIGSVISKNIYYFILLNGPFQSLDEMANVPGLSAKKVGRIIRNNPGRVQL